MMKVQLRHGSKPPTEAVDVQVVHIEFDGKLFELRQVGKGLRVRVALPIHHVLDIRPDGSNGATLFHDEDKHR